MPLLTAKLDTGARSCALHVENSAVVGTFRDSAGAAHDVLRFQVPYILDGREEEMSPPIDLPLLGRIAVRDSGGHTELRPLIQTRLLLGPLSFVTYVTLTRRSEMVFPMLVGRSALAGRFIVDPARRFLTTLPGSIEP